ncbi:unnamed protein product [Moneuplotes crassus]|uniref:Autophagy-related protein n=1 Tax=Euplotes crassus TaxID=5936 RepID=A0AAD1UIE7_EUPCR|nr:unnamed protein product [Moneuplotes crassus]
MSTFGYIFGAGNNEEKRKEPEMKIGKSKADKIPVVIEYILKNTVPGAGPAIFCLKLLVPEDYTFFDFTMAVRKKIQAGAEESLALFVNGWTLFQGSKPMKEIFTVHKASDGILYSKMVLENFLG